MLGLDTLPWLAPTDQGTLRAWLATTSSSRVDTVLDLSSRPWKSSGMSGVIGVYEPGKERASWMLVADGANWVLVDCIGGRIDGTCDTLFEVLRLIGR